MYTIQDSFKKYSSKIDTLDLELIISRAIKKPREFILAHSEEKITKKQETIIKKFIARRLKSEPMAYILGEKEFYGLNFKVNKNVLTPRPETESLVEEILKELKTKNKKLKTTIIDVGTGSGNIIISIARNMEHITHSILYLSLDKSKKALNIARHNAKLHKVDKKIKFLQSDLLKNKKIISNLTIKQFNNLIILANLPYVSSKNYKKYYNQIKFEPKSALLSDNDGLKHYDKLFNQIKKLLAAYCLLHATCIIEFSPEQKNKLNELIKPYFPEAKIGFKKDLAGKWRICKVEIIN